MSQSDNNNSRTNIIIAIIGVIGTIIVAFISNIDKFGSLKKDNAKFDSTATAKIELSPNPIPKPAPNGPLNKLNCPQTSPNGKPLSDQSKYSIHQPRLNHIFIVGHYDNNCKWIAGTYVKQKINHISKCPQNPPNGYVENVSVSIEKPNFHWEKGHWVIQDEECVWMHSSWVKNRN